MLGIKKLTRIALKHGSRGTQQPRIQQQGRHLVHWHCLLRAALRQAPLCREEHGRPCQGHPFHPSQYRSQSQQYKCSRRGCTQENASGGPQEASGVGRPVQPQDQHLPRGETQQGTCRHHERR